MTLVVPSGVQSDGSWKVSFVTTIANTAAPSIATEIKAASSVAAECLLTKGGLGLDNTTEKFKDERLCTVEVYEQSGALTWSINDLNFIIDPQTPASAANKLYALVKNGWQGYMVVRMGKASDVDWATADFIWVIPVLVSIPVPLPPEANTLLRAKASVSVTGGVMREINPVA